MPVVQSGELSLLGNESEPTFSTPPILPGRASPHLASPLTSKVGPLPTPAASPHSAGPRAVRLSLSTLKRRRPEGGPKTAVETQDACVIVTDSDVHQGLFAYAEALEQGLGLGSMSCGPDH